jgi:hypothetical protein
MRRCYGIILLTGLLLAGCAATPTAPSPVTQSQEATAPIAQATSVDLSAGIAAKVAADQQAAAAKAAADRKAAEAKAKAVADQQAAEAKAKAAAAQQAAAAKAAAAQQAAAAKAVADRKAAEAKAKAAAAQQAAAAKAAADQQAQQAPASAPAPQPGETVTPGAFCSPDGATGVTVKGTSMICSTKPGDTRDRWRKA